MKLSRKRSISQAKANSNYLFKLKYNYIKNFVDIKPKKKPTRADKIQVNKYYRETRRLIGRPSYVYKTKSEKHLKQALEYSQQDAKRYPHFKVAFIPTAQKAPKIEFKKDGLKIKSKYVTETAIKFPKMTRKEVRKFIASPKSYIDALVMNYPKETLFSLRIGKSKWRHPYKRDSVGENIEKQINTWGDSKEKIVAHFWGLSVYKFTNQKKFVEYRNTEEEYYKKKRKFNPLRGGIKKVKLNANLLVKANKQFQKSNPLKRK